MSRLIIGSHVDLASPEFLLGSVKKSISYDANAFMIYTGAPQNSFRRPISDFKVKEAHDLMASNNIEKKNIIVHAPYIINLGNSVNEELYQMSKRVLAIELERVAAMGFKTLVLHPGSHVKMGSEVAIKRIIDGINDILDHDQSDVVIALETMAGKGSEIGSTFEEIAEIIDGIHKKERIGVCLDTCHMFDSGISIANADDLVDKIDKTIGLKYIKVLHINDSKNAFSSHKDRHENIGYGNIGFDTLLNIVHHEAFTEIPKILETPYVNEKAPYSFEIKMLRNKAFDSTLK